MINHGLIIDMIKNGYECEFLDFKKSQYKKENYHEFIVDVMAMANAEIKCDKYIIIGIKDKPDGIREIYGIPRAEFSDSSILQNILINNIEPEISIQYLPFEHDDKLIGVLKICSCNQDRPYMLKKRYQILNEGLCKIRKGSNNLLTTRRDYDMFYASKEQFEIKFMENTLMAVYNREACARTSITIRNLTKKPVVINYGLLSVCECGGKILSKHRVYGFGDKIIGADFQLSIAPMEERLGNLFVGFGSSDCLRIGLDEDGCSFEVFKFDLLLTDTNNNEYSCSIDNGVVNAKGDILWKVQKKARESK